MLTTKELTMIGKMTAEVIREHLSDVLPPLIHRIKAMEDRLAEAETRGLQYMGIHQRALDYKRGDVVTHGGSLWIALRATGDAPGASDCWQLAVKGK
jgi:hypothetical protein